MKAAKLILIGLAVSTLTACAEQGGPLTREGIGTATGAVAGGVLGSTIGGGAGRTAAIVGGALLGGFLGNKIGSSMDRNSIAAYDNASQRALTTGEPQSWNNPASNQQGTITPTRRYASATGQPCRDFNQTIYMSGERYDGSGSVCQRPDGSWVLITK